MKPLIGVLALQGDFAEHRNALERCGARTVDVRFSYQVEELDGLVIPGGESTAIAKLSADNPDPIFDTIKAKIAAGMPVYGTCMGSIFLARSIEGSRQGRLALMDITVRRNAFGPQRASFETMMEIPALGVEPFPAIFIRGPVITEVGKNVEVLATLEDGIVMARQDHMLVTAFHPEVTDDDRVHAYFLSMIGKSKQINANQTSRNVVNPSPVLANV